VDDQQQIGGDGQEFRTLEFDGALRDVQTAEVKFSRGFLAADLTLLFSDFAQYWVGLFQAAGADLQLIDIRRALYFPQELSRIVVVEVNGESSVIGIDEMSQELICSILSPDAMPASQEVLIEYLERRLLTTLTKSWNSPDPLFCYYLSSDWEDEVEILGGVELQFTLNGRPASIWFGLGPRMLDELDRLWKRHLLRNAPSKFDDDVSTLTIDVAQLAVPPAMLIDYLRAGTIIDLEVPRDDLYTLSLNGQPWGRGRLCRFNRALAVEVVDLQPPQIPPVQGRTRVVVELARLEVDQNTLLEYRQAGSIIPFGKTIGSLVSVMINSEHVANALLGEVNGRLAMSVVPKE